jgi:hypothetical protein
MHIACSNHGGNEKSTVPDVCIGCNSNIREVGLEGEQSIERSDSC